MKYIIPTDLIVAAWRGETVEGVRPIPEDQHGRAVWALLHRYCQRLDRHLTPWEMAEVARLRKMPRPQKVAYIRKWFPDYNQRVKTRVARHVAPLAEIATRTAHRMTALERRDRQVQLVRRMMRRSATGTVTVGYVAHELGIGADAAAAVLRLASAAEVTGGS